MATKSVISADKSQVSNVSSGSRGSRGSRKSSSSEPTTTPRRTKHKTSTPNAVLALGALVDGFYRGNLIAQVAEAGSIYTRNCRDHVAKVADNTWSPLRGDDAETRREDIVSDESIVNESFVNESFVDESFVDESFLDESFVDESMVEESIEDESAVSSVGEPDIDSLMSDEMQEVHLTSNSNTTGSYIDDTRSNPNVIYSMSVGSQSSSKVSDEGGSTSSEDESDDGSASEVHVEQILKRIFLGHTYSSSYSADNNSMAESSFTGVSAESTHSELMDEQLDLLKQQALLIDTILEDRVGNAEERKPEAPRKSKVPKLSLTAKLFGRKARRKALLESAAASTPRDEPQDRSKARESETLQEQKYKLSDQRDSAIKRGNLSKKNKAGGFVVELPSSRSPHSHRQLVVKQKHKGRWKNMFQHNKAKETENKKVSHQTGKFFKVSQSTGGEQNESVRQAPTKNEQLAQASKKQTSTPLRDQLRDSKKESKQILDLETMAVDHAMASLLQPENVGASTCKEEIEVNYSPKQTLKRSIEVNTFGPKSTGPQNGGKLDYKRGPDERVLLADSTRRVPNAHTASPAYSLPLNHRVMSRGLPGKLEVKYVPADRGQETGKVVRKSKPLPSAPVPTTAKSTLDGPNTPCKSADSTSAVLNDSKAAPAPMPLLDLRVMSRGLPGKLEVEYVPTDRGQETEKAVKKPKTRSVPAPTTAKPTVYGPEKTRHPCEQGKLEDSTSAVPNVSKVASASAPLLDPRAVSRGVPLKLEVERVTTDQNQCTTVIERKIKSPPTPLPKAHKESVGNESSDSFKPNRMNPKAIEPLNSIKRPAVSEPKKKQAYTVMSSGPTDGLEVQYIANDSSIASTTMDEGVAAAIESESVAMASNPASCNTSKATASAKITQPTPARANVPNVPFTVEPIKKAPSHESVKCTQSTTDSACTGTEKKSAKCTATAVQSEHSGTKAMTGSRSEVKPIKTALPSCNTAKHTTGNAESVKKATSHDSVIQIQSKDEPISSVTNKDAAKRTTTTTTKSKQSGTKPMNSATTTKSISAKAAPDSRDATERTTGKVESVKKSPSRDFVERTQSKAGSPPRDTSKSSAKRTTITTTTAKPEESGTTPMEVSARVATPTKTAPPRRDIRATKRSTGNVESVKKAPSHASVKQTQKEAASPSPDSSKNSAKRTATTGVQSAQSDTMITKRTARAATSTKTTNPSHEKCSPSKVKSVKKSPSRDAVQRAQSKAESVASVTSKNSVLCTTMKEKTERIDTKPLKGTNSKAAPTAPTKVSSSSRVSVKRSASKLASLSIMKALSRDSVQRNDSNVEPTSPIVDTNNPERVQGNTSAVQRPTSKTVTIRNTESRDNLKRADSNLGSSRRKLASNEADFNGIEQSPSKAESIRHAPSRESTKLSLSKDVPSSPVSQEFEPVEHEVEERRDEAPSNSITSGEQAGREEVSSAEYRDSSLDDSNPHYLAQRRRKLRLPGRGFPSEVEIEYVPKDPSRKMRSSSHSGDDCNLATKGRGDGKGRAGKEKDYEFKLKFFTLGN